MKALKKLSLTRTKGEWREVEKKMNKSNKKDFSCFLRSEINTFLKTYYECPNCVIKAKGQSIEKRPYIFPHQLKELEPIANRMKIPVSTLVDRLIITPLLYS